VKDAVATMDGLLPDDQRGLIQIDGPTLPIAPCLSDAALRAAVPNMPCTSLRDGFAATLEDFRRLHAAGQLPLDDIEN
jgi:hypothetical protein